MDIKFTRKNGSSLRLSDIAVQAIDFVLSSIELKSVYEEIEGRHGREESETTYLARIIRVPFYYKATDLLDFPLIRDEIFRQVGRIEPLYLQEIRRAENKSYTFVDTHEPAAMKDVEESISRKMHFARIQKVIEIEQDGLFGEGELEFETVGLPFGISEGTSLDPRTFDAELWQVGQGIKADDLKYAHDTTEFRIYNAGDIDIDPAQMPLHIKYQGASSNLKIINVTTDDTWSYSGTSTVNDSINIEGIRSSKNGSNILSNTNKKLISLAPGWNDIQLQGTEGDFLISFDFPFYYL